MSRIRSACPNCGDVATRGTYDIGSGPELSCGQCEWCWGAEGQDLKPAVMPDGLPGWAYPATDPRSPDHDPGPPGDGEESMDALVAASSLGSPGVRALADRTPPTVARAIQYAADCLHRAEVAEAKLAEVRASHHDFVGASGSKMGGLVIELHAALDALRRVVLLTEPVGGVEPGSLVLVDGTRVAEVARAALAPLPAQPDFALPAENRRWLAETVGPALLEADWDAPGALGITKAEAAVMFVCGHYLGHLTAQGLVVSLDSGAGPGEPQVERVLAGAAHYFSTYCLHDRHGECRETCKFCPALCRCACHQATPVG